MIVTTLRTGALTLLSVQYKFELGVLSVRFTTDGAHKLYGNVDITLANVQNSFFNQTLSFKRESADQLIYSSQVDAGVTPSTEWVTLPNNGTAITATVANSFIDLPINNYNFLLLDTVDSNFSTSSISIKQTNIGFTGVDGLEAELWGAEDLTATPPKYSINNADLSFDYPVRVSIKNNNPNVTNIPLIIT